VLARPRAGCDHAFCCALAEAAGHEDAGGFDDFVPRGEVFLWIGCFGARLEVVAVDPADVEFLAAPHGRVFEGFYHREVGILELDVFADQGDGDRVVVARVVAGEGLPLCPGLVAFLLHDGRDLERVEGEELAHHGDELLLLEKHGHLVDGRHVAHDNDLFGVDLAEVRYLLDGRGLEVALASTGDLEMVSISSNPAFRASTYQIRNQTITPHRLDRLLRRLRLLLSVNHRHVTNVDLHEVVLSSSSPQLAHSFDERHALNITDCASQLDNADIRLLASVVDRYPRHLLYPFLDRVCDVGYHLHRLAEIVAFALALNDVLVDLAGCDVVVACEGDVEVTLVVAEIEIDFAAVGEDEYFAVPLTC
jgi:hypothetical protein